MSYSNLCPDSLFVPCLCEPTPRECRFKSSALYTIISLVHSSAHSSTPSAFVYLHLEFSRLQNSLPKQKHGTWPCFKMSEEGHVLS